MNRLQILTGDCRDILPTLEAGSVQCCVTSPPYWGLRDYGTAQWEGGDAGCEHLVPNSYRTSTLGLAKGVASHESAMRHAEKTGHIYKALCGQCGARRIDSQLGLESTPEEYIEKMVAVFRAVWRVLRDDGTLWINLGDSYAGSSAIGWREGNLLKNGGNSNRDGIGRVPGLKPKDLCMMPARLALAMQADGWYLRSEIVWHKPNPMPESVTDRPTKAHEMIYLLAKRERYFYDAEAIREPQIEPGRINHGGGYRHDASGASRCGSGFPASGESLYNPAGRNKRTVWTVATQPYAEAHFATFPEEIPKLCILAGTKVGDTVLDPFAGSGTVGQVALELGRRAILIELNPAYVELALDRTFVTPGFL
jgi:site-specific DNA-methyltransferase (cytosine-N4-specific)